MIDIAGNIALVRERIARAEATASQTGAWGDQKPRTKLMLAAKHQPIENIRAAIDAGATLFGHNQVQQLVAMVDDLGTLGEGSPDGHLGNQNPEILTTVIGHVQSNKLSQAMQYAQRIDTVDSIRTARQIARRQQVRLDEGLAVGPYPILLQVNSSGAPTQFGCEPGELIELSQQVSELESVRIDGLMTIGAQGDEATVRESFCITRALSESMREIPGLENATELSMGMTGDLEIAVEEGSTLVRVGSAVFGPRSQA